MISISTLCTLCMFFLLQQPAVQQNVSPAVFVGTWVGVQTWAIENPSLSAREPQTVTLAIQLVGGKLVGTMTPFFGGLDAATFVNTEIVGDELRATAAVAKPKPEVKDEKKEEPKVQPKAELTGESQSTSAPATPPKKPWTDAVRVTFLLKADRENLAGTADVLMGDVNWLKFKYDLGKKRSRY